MELNSSEVVGNNANTEKLSNSLMKFHGLKKYF